MRTRLHCIHISRSFLNAKEKKTNTIPDVMITLKLNKLSSRRIIRLFIFYLISIKLSYSVIVQRVFYDVFMCLFV